MFLVFDGINEHKRAIDVQSITGMRSGSDETIIEYEAVNNHRSFYSTSEPLESVVKRVNKALYDLNSRSLAVSAQAATPKDW